MNTDMPLKQKITTQWVISFYNSNKSASFQDKLNELLSEKNPFYLIEWLLFPASADLLAEINYTRSPGMFRNSYVPFAAVLFDQLLYELCFNDRLGEERKQLLILTALADLQTFYEHKEFNDSFTSWLCTLDKSVEQYRVFESLVAKEQQRIEQKYRAQKKEINLNLDLNEQEKEVKLQTLQEELFRKVGELPGQLLNNKFSDWPFTAFIYHKQWNNPEAKIQSLRNQASGWKSHKFLIYLQQKDIPSISQDLNEDPFWRTQFTDWFTTYASKNSMTRSMVHTDERQIWWENLLLITSDIDVFAATFAIKGFEEVMLLKKVVPPYFNKLVDLAFTNKKWLHWISEIVILRNWDVFMSRFLKPEYSFDELSWVLCLDPKSMEQRLIRAGKNSKGYLETNVDPIFIIERCCTIFSDGIHAGMSEQVMIPIFNYLALHNKDTLYQYIYSIKSLDEIILLLQMDQQYLLMLFNGENPRAKTARNQLKPFFLDLLENGQLSEQEGILLNKLSRLLFFDRNKMVLSWLEQWAEQTTSWDVQEASLLADVFELEWLGANLTEDEQHTSVVKWLSSHSDWINFDLDMPRNNNSIRYRILRPGIKNLNDNYVVARILVRAVWINTNEINSFLEDLKDI